MNSSQNPRPPGNALVAWFASNPAAANIFMLFFILAGIGSVSSMVKETFPIIDPLIINITVPFPGATPSDVESGITRRIEEAVIGIQGVERVESNARENIGVVTVEIKDFFDGNQVLNDVETEIDSLQDFPPENAEEVNIVKVKPRGGVLTLAIFGDAPEITLRDWAEKIEGQLLALPDVSLVEISGTREREISIEISEEQLRKYDLTLGEVADRIRAFSIDLPAGTLRTSSAEVIVRVQERRYYGPEFKKIVIRANEDGSFIRLGDIATIRDDFEDVQISNSYNGQPAIFLNINRSSSQDTLKIEDQIQNYLATTELPEMINISVWQNETDILKDRMNLLARNALLGFTLVFIALLLFLDLKLAFWVALAIPISFLGGIFLASLLGVTINMISLFALIVVIGIVVDDAIIAGESIFNEQEQQSGQWSTLRGVQMVQAPVTIGVLTTIAAFSPLIFSTGVLGQILQTIPIVVISVLIISLFEAFLILPAHLSHPGKWSIGLLRTIRRYVAAGLSRFIEKIVLPLANFFITTRYIFVILVSLIVFIAFYTLISGQLKFIFFPQIESDEITVNLEMPVGTPYETTAFYTERIVQAFETLNEDLKAIDGSPIFENFAVSIGLTTGDRGGPGSTSSSSAASHLADIQVELVPSDARTFTAREISRKWQEQIGEIPQVRKISFKSSLVHGGADVNIELSHRNSDILDRASEEMKRRMKEIPFLSEVDDSLEPGKKEFVFELTGAGIAAGLSPFEVGRQLRDAFRGREVDRIQRGTSEIEVIVRYPEAERETRSTIDDLRFRLPSGKRAPANLMATIREEYSPSVIKRVDGRQVVSVTADVDESRMTPNEAISLIRSKIYRDLEQRYPDLRFALAGQNKDQRQDLATLGKNMLIALMLIFVMLTSQLRSYAKPFVIMTTIPLGIAGAIYGHLLLGFNLSFVSLFGIVALTGVVINDSVVLVDYYNYLLRQNDQMQANQAALEAIRRRFRPILLTTLTTTLGLLPMLLETSLQAQFIIPMAVSLACGLFFASSFLIFQVPVLLVIIEDISSLLRQRLNP